MKLKLLAILIIAALATALFSAAQAGPLAQAATETPTATITATPRPLPTMHLDGRISYGQYSIVASVLCLGVLILTSLGTWLILNGLDKRRRA